MSQSPLIPFYSNAKLVFYGDLFLLALFGFVTIFYIPRCMQRLRSCRKGFLLWHDSAVIAVPFHPLPIPNIGSSDTNSDCGSMTNGKDGLTCPLDATQLPEMKKQRIASILRRCDLAGFSVGRAIIWSLYGTTLAFLVVYNSNMFTDPGRTGFVAMSQIPFVFAFAMKNNVFALLIGVGYMKLRHLHRLAGRVLAVLIHIHTFGYSTSSALQPDVLWGFAALICLDIITISSIVHWRSYRLFFYTHWLCALLFLMAVFAHKPALTPYVFLATCIYGLDFLFRLIKCRICVANARRLCAELPVIVLEMPYLNTGWRTGGQHVLVHVLSSCMGWWGCIETHVFTITSTCTEDNGLAVMLRRRGYWTNKLCKMATSDGTEVDANCKVKVVIEGPYDGPGPGIYANYSAVVLICGGSGIIFVISLVLELLQGHLDGTNYVEAIELVWIVQDPECLESIYPRLTSIVQQHGIFINICVCYNKRLPPRKKFVLVENLPGLLLTASRPDVGALVTTVMTHLLSSRFHGVTSEPLFGVAIGVCGPVESDMVLEAVQKLDHGMLQSTGGVKVYQE